MMYREVTVKVEASVPEGQNAEEWRSELIHAIELAQAMITKACNWAEVLSNGIRVKVSTD